MELSPAAAHVDASAEGAQFRHGVLQGEPEDVTVGDTVVGGAQVIQTTDHQANIGAAGLTDLSDGRRQAGRGSRNVPQGLSRNPWRDSP
ncbi:hypothetical protein GCM10018782_43380 [Streptomyces griseoaurantiacus]|nr:hypothetical protein GCM10018782_43380 [Streptomyces griseoaurantiacus]